MADTTLLRLLELACRELGALDARVEIGGRDPDDPRSLWCRLPNGWRLTVLFDAVPADRSALEQRLELLAQSFAGAATTAEADWVALTRELASRRLDAELSLLAEKAGAIRAMVIDAQSPVLWGTSGTRRTGEDVEAALETADAAAAARKAGVDPLELLELEGDAGEAQLVGRGVERRAAQLLTQQMERIRSERRHSADGWRHHLLITRAIAEVRRELEAAPQLVGHRRELSRGEGYAHLTRGFASIYCLIVLFEGQFSELHAEAAVVHALPAIENLVLALPPVEPPPRGGKVIRLERR